MNCYICTKELSHIQLIRGNNTCSTKCRDLAHSQRMKGRKSSKRKTGTIISCATCATEFYIQRCLVGKKTFCSKQCYTIGRKGRQPWNTGKHRLSMMGSKNWNWRGGTTEEYQRIRTSLEYKVWRKSVFERDNYMCTECGDATGGNLEADHILPFAYYPELRFDITNGRTLCIPCHKKTPTWGRKAQKYATI